MLLVVMFGSRGHRNINLKVNHILSPSYNNQLVVYALQATAAGSRF
jgi:hypothetical protein